MSVGSERRPTANRESFREFVVRCRRICAAQLGIDRTGISVQESPLRARAAAWAAIIGLFVLGWGKGTVNALVYLFEWREVPEVRPASSVEEGAMGLLGDVALVLISAVLIWAFRQYAGASPQPITRATFVRALPAAYVATFIGFYTAGVLGTIFSLKENRFDAPSFDDPLQAFVNITSDGMAGPTEELALMAVLVVALRATGYSWVTVCVAAAVVRVPFHLYYGWGAIGLAAWAVLIVLLYKRTGAIIAIILEHASFNMLNHVPYGIGGMVKIALTIAGTIIVIRALRRAAEEDRLAEVTPIQR